LFNLSIPQNHTASPVRPTSSTVLWFRWSRVQAPSFTPYS